MARFRSSRETTGKGNRGTLVFGVIWTLISSVFLVIGLRTTWESIQVGGWDKVPCVIERFEILADKEQDPPFRADLVYHYHVDGRKFSGTRLWRDQKGSDDYEDLAQVREELSQGPEGLLASPAGVSAECRVNPEDPAESSLAGKGGGGLAGGIMFSLFGGFFVLIGMGLVGWGIKGGGTPAKSRGAAEEAPLFVVIAAFGFFACAGLGVLGGVVLPTAFEWASMRGWRQTDAEVIWSRVTSKSDSDGTTYAVDLFYRYRFQGKQYRSNRYHVTGVSSSGSKNKRKVVRAHPPGSKLQVFVDPDQPWRAVVRRDAGWAGLFALFPLPFLAIGFGGLWWTFKKRN